MSFHPSEAHDDCYWTCDECGGKVLYDSACMGCWDECDAEEPMKSRPDDGLCRECNPRPHGRDIYGLVCKDAWCECDKCCEWDSLRSDRKPKQGRIPDSERASVEGDARRDAAKDDKLTGDR